MPKSVPWGAIGLLVVLVVALIVRLVRLGTVPANLTADEADFFQNIYHILAGKGPGLFGFDWTPSPALGVYFMAGTVKVFGSSWFGIRMASVLLSVATLIPFFFLARERLSYLASLLATLLLATNLWFLHFSRTAWTNMNGDLFAAGGALMLTLAIRKGRYYYYAGAGAFAALGVYGYFSARLLPLFFLAYLPFALFLNRGHRIRILKGYAVLALTCFLVFLPQIRPVVDNWDKFNNRADVTFIFNQTKPYLGENDMGHILLRQASWSAQAFILVDGGGFLHHGGLWPRYIPRDRGLLDPLARGLFLLGLLVAAWRWRETALWWIMFLGPVLTVQVFSSDTPDVARGLIAAPFMFLFVGQGIDLLLSIARRVAPRTPWAYIAVALALVGAASLSAVTEACAYFDWMNDPFALAGRQPAVTREEFPEWQQLQQEAARRGEWGFSVSQWRSRQDHNGCAQGGLPLILCEEPSPGEEAPPETEAERDAQRGAGLGRLSVALREYRDKYGSYPSTGGGIQSLCIHLDIDAGCELGEFLKPLPKESLGPPYGYWYESDGSTFTLYTALESPPPGEELCSSNPAHLAGVQYLWCVKGP
jgi:4-amino-4-deoxy-L-arabinose transferase-like glycosyltransferase